MTVRFATATALLGAAIGTGAVAIAGGSLGACAGLHPSESADAAPGAFVPLPVVLPAGGRCGPPMTAVQRPAPLDVVSSTDPDAGAGGDAACTDCFSPAIPVGVGYRDTVASVLLPHVAYLTFDDGPSDWTNDFLDILRDKGVHATFFLTARQGKPYGLDYSYVDEYGHTTSFTDLIRREIVEGHVIANHTTNHPDLGTIDDVQIQSELDEDELRVNVALVQSGLKPQLLTLFRPPYGSPWYGGTVPIADPLASETAVAAPIEGRAVNVMWTLDSTDSAEWVVGESYSRTPGLVHPDVDAGTYSEKMVRIRETIATSDDVVHGRGVIILMHDTHDTTRDVLVDIIDGLAAAGYSFDTIESYVKWRWGRPSLELTPGPSLHDTRVPPSDQGCESFAGSAGASTDGGSLQVCGRMWLAFSTLGGSAVLGAPLSPAAQPASGGALVQAFEHGTIELHPEYAPPCNVVFVPR